MKQAEPVELERKKLFEKLLKNNLTTFLITFHPKEAPKFGLVKKPVFTDSPSPIAKPYKWDYSMMRELLYELGTLLSAEEAERRQVQLVNPSLREYPYLGAIAISPTIFAAIQLVKAGEVAPTHYHTPNAFRLILEAPEDGAYTVVNGKRITMRRGDLVLTPSYAWHDHRNESDNDVIWLDGLDAPLVWYMGGIFFKDYAKVHGENVQPVKLTDEDLLATYGSGFRPEQDLYDSYDPLFIYPYSRAKNALRSLVKRGTMPPEGYVVRYLNPVTGKDLFQTMALKMRLIPPGGSTASIRRTEHIVMAPLEGRCRVTLEDASFDLVENDVAIIPPWSEYRIQNTGNKDLVVFSYSDEPLFRAIGIYQEEVGKNSQSSHAT
ncbi:MAG: cupin domain-containing protein [Thermoplasmataceae archaeon]